MKRKGQSKRKLLSEKFDFLRKELGPVWDKEKCICEALLRDEPCSLNCKEFNKQL